MEVPEDGPASTSRSKISGSWNGGISEGHPRRGGEDIVRKPEYYAVLEIFGKMFLVNPSTKVVKQARTRGRTCLAGAHLPVD